MSDLENAINIAPETGETNINTDLSTQTTDLDTQVNEDGSEVTIETETLPLAEEEKEPTVKEMMALIKLQGDEIKKSNNRTGYLQRKIDRSNGRVQTPAGPAKLKPTSAQFETNEEYLDAVTDWKMDERQRVTAENQAKQHDQDQMEDFDQLINSGADKYPDFNEVARKPFKEGGPDITPSMVEAMMAGDKFIDIAYELGKDVQLSQKIAGMSPIQAAREIGLIESRLAGGQSKTPQKTQTKTITPSSPIVGKTVSDKSLENQDMDSFMSSRNKADGVG